MSWSSQGQIALREIGDGRAVWIYPKLYTFAICIGAIGASFFDDTWCYASEDAARTALGAWNPLEQKEPEGWIRHPFTGRRRPEGEEREYINR